MLLICLKGKQKRVKIPVTIHDTQNTMEVYEGGGGQTGDDYSF